MLRSTKFKYLTGITTARSSVVIRNGQRAQATDLEDVFADTTITTTDSNQKAFSPSFDKLLPALK